MWLGALIRFSLKGIAWLLGFAALALALLFGINATDEALSEESLAAMKVPPLPAPSETNGFLDFLVLGAPAQIPTFETAVKQLDLLRKRELNDDVYRWVKVAIDARIPKCQFGNSSCLDAAAANPQLRELIDGHQVFLQRYRAMREKPEFIDLFEPTSPEYPLPAYQYLGEGSRLSLLGAAVRFNTGDRAGAIRELELEYAFWRKVAIGARTLLDKMIAFAFLDRAGLLAADLARRIPPRDTALWTRLNAMLRAPTKEELDVLAVMKQERAMSIGWMRTRRYVRMSDSMYETFGLLGEPRSRPWWDPLAPYLYRPHQNVNQYVAQGNIMLEIAKYPATEFENTKEALLVRAHALEPGLIARMVLSPIGPAYFGQGGHDSSDYFRRAHGHAGLQTLVRLQVRLRAAGITRPEDVARALAGPLGQAHPDPFTGKSVRFDRGQSTLSFEAQAKHLTGPARNLLKNNAKVELPL